MNNQVPFRTDLPAVDAFSSALSVRSLLRTNPCVVVEKGGAFLGILTPMDMALRPHRLVVDCISDTPRLDRTTDLQDCYGLMTSLSLEAIPMFDAEAFEGVVLYHDVLEALRQTLGIKEEQQRRLEGLQGLEMLVAGVSHDLNNLFCKLQAHILLLESELGQNDSYFDHIEGLNAGVTMGIDLTRQLTARNKITFTCVDDDDVESVIRRTVQFYLLGTKVTFVLNRAEHLPPVKADMGRFAQVISNLTVNAIQAMNRFGTITVTLKVVAVSGKDNVEIRFADTGPGMSPPFPSGPSGPKLFPSSSMPIRINFFRSYATEWAGKSWPPIPVS